MRVAAVVLLVKKRMENLQCNILDSFPQGRRGFRLLTSYELYTCLLLQFSSKLLVKRSMPR